LNVGPVGDDDNPLKIGNGAGAGTTARPFDGLLDNLRLFGSATDGSGVLNTAELESFRQADVQNVQVSPEPPMAAVLMLLVAPALGLRRTHCRDNGRRPA
jgi:hypothetical protein